MLKLVGLTSVGSALLSNAIPDGSLRSRFNDLVADPRIDGLFFDSSGMVYRFRNCKVSPEKVWEGD